MTDFYQGNIDALARYEANAPLLKRLAATPLPGQMELYETQDGGIGLVYQGVPLHHPDGAISEAQQEVQTHYKHHPHGIHLLLGMGLGYPLAELSAQAKQCPDSAILVYEPHLPLLRFVLENVDIAPYCYANRVIISDHPLEFYQQIETLYQWGKSELDILVLPAYAALLKQDIPALLQKIGRLIESRQFAGQVGQTLSQQWLAHFIGNLPELTAMSPVDRLVGVFNQKPAVIVSPGPSLDTTIDSLLACQDRVVIISTGRALRPLLNAGIQPDFAVFLDYEGQAAQLTGLSESLIKNMCFIVGPYVEPHVLQTACKQAFLAHLKPFPFSPWLDKALNRNTLNFESAGAVSSLALQAAQCMGCHPLILLGQDLAFQENKQYAQLSQTAGIENSANISLNADPPNLDARLQEVPGQQGETLLTTSDYRWFIHAFESLAETMRHHQPGLGLYNDSPGGAQINGFTNKSLAGVLSDIASPGFDKQRPLMDTQPPSDVQNISDFRKVLSAIRQLRQLSQDVDSVAVSGLDLLATIGNKAQWELKERVYRAIQHNLIRLVESDGLLGMALAETAQQYNRSILPDGERLHWPQIVTNLKITEAFLSACRQVIQAQLLAGLGDLEAALLARLPDGLDAERAVMNQALPNEMVFIRRIVPTALSEQ